MSKLPIFLIIDDGSPINTFCFHHINCYHELHVPPVMAKTFGTVCAKYGVRGKFSVLPIPLGLGRLDGKINLVDNRTKQQFIRNIKTYVAPHFSITPELLTHFMLWDEATQRTKHLCEDVWVSTASDEAIADYLTLGLEILDNVGLRAEGISSPWRTGLDNEINYARGVGLAFKRKYNLDRSFYVCGDSKPMPNPLPVIDTPETGKVVRLIPNCPDPFWGTQLPNTDAQARRNARKGLDSLISADGRKGRIRELVEANTPVVMITHWQSLFGDGRMFGLEAFEVLCERIQKYFGDTVQWVTPAEFQYHC